VHADSLGDAPSDALGPFLAGGRRPGCHLLIPLPEGRDTQPDYHGSRDLTARYAVDPQPGMPRNSTLAFATLVRNHDVSSRVTRRECPRSGQERFLFSKELRPDCINYLAVLSIKTKSHEDIRVDGEERENKKHRGDKVAKACRSAGICPREVH
jgi:hypothetical protein